MTGRVRYAEVVGDYSLDMTKVRLDGVDVLVPLANRSYGYATRMALLVQDGRRLVAYGDSRLVTVTDHYAVAGVSGGTGGLRGTFRDSEGVVWTRIKYVSVTGAAAAIWYARAACHVGDMPLPADEFITGDPDTVATGMWVPPDPYDAGWSQLGLLFPTTTGNYKTSTSTSQVTFTPLIGTYAGYVLGVHSGDQTWNFAASTPDSRPYVELKQYRFYVGVAPTFTGDAIVPAGAKSLMAGKVNNP